ncbi:alcohol dehydrogenase catalytic domain-containing protein [bacterium]|nr:alcohol dehydrogenase catalytic domain-containing protein [bacterium]OIO89156.1 MAG: alcohol dehydrogenase [Anaerolineae bacterium CG2_30_58_95]PIU90704.1 MAG: alcohol dehydrogenase [Anaerolineae bacterium CG06_land_8_20_14_3_00_57_67]PIW20531.1 MAG: alcohol dehydrogenase [Anaerolineae bacterium CG17_big_fil_post_rev_8_21_14_2_50_57_27]PIX47356.1 MAG: alcohol dehydrogenase [Anaerolineae bacterium CG_4_8_14_3_um_filter_59_70]
MQALWLENGQLSLREVPIPAPPLGEALIRVRLSGICGTDLELVRGYYPFTGIPGHEFVGEVVESPDSSWIGKRVVGEINVACGECEQCKNGRPTHCEKRTVLGIMGRHGAHAGYTSLPLANLHIVPDSVPDEAAVFTEPLAAALEIQEQVHIQPTDRVLLIGAGRLGQLIAQTLALTGCDLRVVARHPHQQALLAARRIGVIAEDEIRPRRWDVVVEATGCGSGFDLGRRALRPRGTLVLKSTYKGEMSVNGSSIVVDEITILGSRCGPFAPALRLLAARAVDPSVLIAARYPLAKVLQAFEEAQKTGMLKVLVEM